MRLYLIEAKAKGYSGYDCFSGAVVIAKDEDQAKLLHPNGDYDSFSSLDYTWVDTPEKVDCTYLGEADEYEPRVVLASYHAG